jgi:hypothetical protein
MMGWRLIARRAAHRRGSRAGGGRIPGQPGSHPDEPRDADGRVGRNDIPSTQVNR